MLMDGARSIANSGLFLTSMGEFGVRMMGERFMQIQPVIERQIHPLLWDPLLFNILRLPVAFIALAFGFLMLWLGRSSVQQIGYLTRQ